MRQYRRRLLLRDNRLVGAMLYGDARDGPWFGKFSPAAICSRLIFGSAYCAHVAPEINQAGEIAEPIALQS